VPERWKPWRPEEVEALVRSEVNSLPGESRAALLPLVVPAELIAAATGPGSDGQSYWLIARAGNQALYWDSIEEEFGTGTLQGQVLQSFGTDGQKLEWSLQYFLTRPTGHTSG